MATPALEKRPAKRLFITDFDGTLVQRGGPFSERDIDALHRLGELGVVRVIATGRSIHSFMKTGGADLPVDYLISSTGAALSHFPGAPLIRKMNLTEEEVRACAEVLVDEDLDFMVQHPLPDNHRFVYRASGRENPDFRRRIAINNGHCGPMGSAVGLGPASQLLAVVTEGETDRALRRVRESLPDLSVIQATSPLDGRSTWIEIFPAGVSKSHTAAWLARELGIRREDTVSVGNDYNDLDLLEWSGRGYVVENAPESLKEAFNVVAAGGAGGVAEAIESWLNGAPCPLGVNGR